MAAHFGRNRSFAAALWADFALWAACAAADLSPSGPTGATMNSSLGETNFVGSFAASRPTLSSCGPLGPHDSSLVFLRSRLTPGVNLELGTQRLFLDPWGPLCGPQGSRNSRAATARVWWQPPPALPPHVRLAAMRSCRHLRWLSHRRLTALRAVAAGGVGVTAAVPCRRQ